MAKSRRGSRKSGSGCCAYGNGVKGAARRKHKATKAPTQHKSRKSKSSRRSRKSRKSRK